MEQWWNDDSRGKPKNLGEKFSPNATFFTTNFKGRHLGQNMRLHDEKPASYHLNYAMANKMKYPSLSTTT
jgi:hypothetical protein